MPSPKAVVQATLAYILLVLYAVTVSYMISAVVECARTSGCTTVSTSQGMLYIVTTVGGLVSALVIASLTVSTPTNTLSLAGLEGIGPERAMTFLTWLYVGVWALTGLAALIVGVMLYPNRSQTVSDLGTSWLGLAVSGAFAYFRVSPPPDGPQVSGQRPAR